MSLLSRLSFSDHWYECILTGGRSSVDIFQGGIRHYILFNYGLVREVQHNPGTTFIFHLLVGVCLVSKYK